MTLDSINILLIEDDLAQARLLQEFLKDSSFNEFNLVHVTRLSEALDAIGKDVSTPCLYNIILLDLTLPDSQGLESLKPLMTRAPCLPIVVLTNINDEQLAIEAVRKGAQDYIVKKQVNPQNPELLVRSIRYAIERKEYLETLRALNQSLKSRVEERTAELLEAKEVNQFKSEFVSILSHDIRNPLNAILLAAGLLKNSDDSLNDDKKVAHYQMIRSAIKSMSLLLDEASFIGRADSGKLNCDLIGIDLIDFCNAIVKEIRLTASQNNINIVFNVKGSSNEFLGDEKLLHHILTNLLGNAVKYSLSNSKVILDLDFQELSVILRVQDSGIGIPEQEQQHLFEPFHRASNVEKIAGTGLGLSIVKKCVDAHGGEITLQSQEGIGSIFTVTLPVISEQ
ncbi:response regulator receiver sensor signal transduction histidine kinase [Calothrix parasitica NIES-267]|uniref:histidine kinase n=1 Tax=Calothrix parasitica NIES-267 TaxID=1973488 RepID=A0A1Z4LKG0_9CYAN|nr:response regulator receiver sensor signal transduction histidine kinase [Calothrix parasitica NIES-267]